MSLMQPQDVAKSHNFEPTLKEYAMHGVPVDCGTDWTWEATKEAVRQGPHQSATTKEAVRLFKEDIRYQVEAGFSRIVD